MRVFAMVAVCALAVASVASAAAPTNVRLHKTFAAPGSRYPGGPAVEEFVKKTGLVDSSGHNTPAYGSVWPVSIFWSYIDVGTPPQRFPVAIDSGSFTLNVPVKGCQGCITKAPNNQYDASASSTSSDYSCTFGCQFGSCSNGMCSYENTYETCDPTQPNQPCSISGPYYHDAVTFAGVSGANVTFGGIATQTAGFYQFATVDGVVGMASPSGGQSVFGSMVAAGVLSDNSWALCLHHGSESNGTLTLGGADMSLATAPFQYTNDVGFQFYSMDFSGMTVGGQSVSGLSDTVVIDSGTNNILLSSEAVSSIEGILSGMCSTTKLVGVCGVSKTLFDGACFSMTSEDMAAFPDFELQFGDVKTKMTPRDYLLLGQPNAPSGEYCWGVGTIEGLQIVGDTLLQNYYVHFDVQNQRIGWAPVNTDTCGSL